MSVDINEQVNLAISMLKKSEDTTEEIIDNIVYQMLNSLNALWSSELATDEELKQINTIVKSRIKHTIYRTDSFLVSHDFEPWFKKRKGSIDMKYWNRYKSYLEKDKHFTKNVTNNIDDVVDEIIDLVGDPKVKTGFQRRGLVIGDVQSGKTSNFIGLMCKACDVGYNLIVILAGTSNELRKQTQSRVDEGLIGIDSDNKLLRNEFIRIGSALYSNEVFAPICVTSLSKDFNKNIANQMSLMLNQSKDAIVFVVKKNVSVLNNLNSWIRSLNQTNDQGLIDASLLVIDDEADYASINTNQEDKDPTKTNAKITELLSLFNKTSYVGFTATPYANIFIDPKTTEEMLTDSLFPKDYIYCLDAPTNYIGARNIFGDEIDECVRTIEFAPENDEELDTDSIHYILPLKHKKDASFEKLPASLKKAIQQFFIGNVIRDLRGDKNSHRSMLINISRFILVHENIRKIVQNYVNSVMRSAILYSKMDTDDWIKDEYMNDLYNTYISDFAKKCEDPNEADKLGIDIINWEMIKENLYDSLSPIVVRVVNQKSKDSMDFNKYKVNGLRVIAIGGIGLSRGLTLEGLMVSYFFRNSIAYDTLMQMGRWFGYRDGYSDLCRIWMTDEAQEAYVSINQATEELRESIVQYKNSGLTPKEFGLKVRTDNNLLITARNKMRSAKEELIECTLSSKIIETRFLDSNVKNIENNYKVTMRLLEVLKNGNEVFSDGKVSPAIGFKNISNEVILDYIKELYIPSANIEFENNALSNFLRENKEILSKWDIALINGKGDNGFDIKKYKYNFNKRVIDIKPCTNLIRISGKRCRVGGPSDSRFGLNYEDILRIKKENNTRCSQTTYFSANIKRNPLLCIYFIEGTYKYDESETNERKKKVEAIVSYSKKVPLVAISIGIPYLGKDGKMIKYALNKIEQGLRERNIYIENGDEEDDEE